jgi:small subunit ribosomal protein S5
MGRRPTQPTIGPDGTELVERVINIKRIAKVVKGGKRMRLSATVVVGDGRRRIGIGHAKSQEVAQAVRKATTQAVKNMVGVSVSGRTIPHEAFGKFSSSKVMLRPAASGTGLIACSQVRATLEAVGLKDVLTKTFGSRNPYNLAMATVRAMQSLRTLREVAQSRNKAISHFVERKIHEAIDGDAQEEPDRSEAVS